ERMRYEMNVAQEASLSKEEQKQIDENQKPPIIVYQYKKNA
ncbi:MAG: hypothetical protein RLZZ321_1837, partial [Bacteroidota bacterium]